MKEIKWRKLRKGESCRYRKRPCVEVMFVSLEDWWGLWMISVEVGGMQGFCGAVRLW